VNSKVMLRISVARTRKSAGKRQASNVASLCAFSKGIRFYVSIFLMYISFTARL
jgi:hypothetical protein